MKQNEMLKNANRIFLDLTTTFPAISKEIIYV